MPVEKISKGQKIAISVNEDLENLYNRFIDQNEFDEFSNPREVLQRCLEMVFKKLTPKIPEETQKRLTALEREIGSLFEENKDLKEKYIAVSAANKELFEENAAYKEECNTMLAQLNAKQVELNSRVKLNKNQYIVEISDLQFQTIKKLIGLKPNIELYRKYNKNGFFAGLVEPIDTENETQNVANFALNTVMIRELGSDLHNSQQLSKPSLAQVFKKLKG